MAYVYAYIHKNIHLIGIMFINQSGFIYNLENRELDKEDFRRILKIGLDCRLTREELEALMPLYNNNGKVDGFEFILTFYHLRFEYRSVQLTRRVSAKKRLTVKSTEEIEYRRLLREQKSRLELKNEVEILVYDDDDDDIEMNRFDDC